MSQNQRPSSWFSLAADAGVGEAGRSLAREARGRLHARLRAARGPGLPQGRREHGGQRPVEPGRAAAAAAGLGRSLRVIRADAITFEPAAGAGVTLNGKAGRNADHAAVGRRQRRSRSPAALATSRSGSTRAATGAPSASTIRRAMSRKAFAGYRVVPDRRAVPRRRAVHQGSPPARGEDPDARRRLRPVSHRRRRGVHAARPDGPDAADDDAAGPALFHLPRRHERQGNLRGGAVPLLGSERATARRCSTSTRPTTRRARSTRTRRVRFRRPRTG